MAELTDLSIAEMARLYREKSLSPREVTAAFLDRIAMLDPLYNAFLRVEAETALEQARQVEEQFTRGQIYGVMQGIPYATKDNVDVAGLPTTCHSKVMPGDRAAADAFIVQKLREAGAILIGKTALHEFAKGGAMCGLPWPPARNPWNPSRHPGGSSSGSGVALAARMVPAAIGTDTGGSIRHPATACGVVGMKPTFGTVSRRGIFPLAFSLDTVGPMTRDVADNAIFFEALRGYDPSEPTSMESEQRSCLSRLRGGIRGMRIGLVEHFYQEDMRAEAEYCAAIDTAVGVLQSLGGQVKRVTLPPLQDWTACGQTILDAEAYAVHQSWLLQRRDDYSRIGYAKLAAGHSIPASKYIQAQQIRAQLRSQFEATMRELDVVITASNMEPPCELDNEAEVARSYGRHARMPFNLTGSPAISVPIGFDTDGLPIGMQIVGKLFDEPTVYRAAWAYCNATPWVRMRPSS